MTKELTTTKTLNDRQKLFLEVLAGEAKGDLAKAKKLAGYSENYPTREILGILRDEIIKIGEDMLAGTAIKAVIGLNDVLDKPSLPGANNKIAAAKEVLDRAGLGKKEQRDVNVKFDGILILPAKDTKQIGTSYTIIPPDSPEYARITRDDPPDYFSQGVDSDESKS